MASNEDQRSSRSRGRWVWLGYWCAMFVMTHIPAGGGPAFIPHYGDKIIHFTLFYLLAFLGGRWMVTSVSRWPLVRLMVWSLVYVGYGALDEWLQSFTGRTMSLGDWFADVFGVAAGTVTIIILGRRRRA